MIKKTELDSLKKYYECKSNHLKSEILDTLNITSIPLLNGLNYDDPSSLLSDILKSGDSDNFKIIMEREILYQEDFNFGPYALYMAEKYNSASGYFYVWESYFQKNKQKKLIPREQWLFMNNLNDDERALAIYSLIISAQMRYPLAIFYLSDYFRQGIYVSKDVNYADLLYNAVN
ncbi:hypothetical protein D0T84_21755 [Dysgonomonas sp. 521]|nr:hypothetical protein [Dysgonomonas sp. 521]